jgi:hypothetical protein
MAVAVPKGRDRATQTTVKRQVVDQLLMAAETSVASGRAILAAPLSGMPAGAGSVSDDAVIGAPTVEVMLFGSGFVLLTICSFVLLVVGDSSLRLGLVHLRGI